MILILQGEMKRLTLSSNCHANFELEVTYRQAQRVYLVEMMFVETMFASWLYFS